MARKQDQEGLPGIPQPPKRKVIDEIEDISLEIDKMCGKRTAQSDAIAEKIATRQGLLREGARWQRGIDAGLYPEGG